MLACGSTVVPATKHLPEKVMKTYESPIGQEWFGADLSWNNYANIKNSIFL
jgi:hypothetical protein